MGAVGGVETKTEVKPHKKRITYRELYSKLEAIGALLGLLLILSLVQIGGLIFVTLRR